jgi:hypothetical protein
MRQLAMLWALNVLQGVVAATLTACNSVNSWIEVRRSLIAAPSKQSDLFKK